MVRFLDMPVEVLENIVHLVASTLPNNATNSTNDILAHNSPAEDAMECKPQGGIKDRICTPKLAAIQDLLELSRTSKYLYYICDNDEKWQKVCLNQYRCRITNNDSKQFYKLVLKRYGHLVDRIFLPMRWLQFNFTETNFEYIKCAFDEETESLVFKRYVSSSKLMNKSELVRMSLSSNDVIKTCVDKQCPDFFQNHRVEIRSFENNTLQQSGTTISLEHNKTSTFLYGLPQHPRLSYQTPILKDGYFIGDSGSGLSLQYYVQSHGRGLVLTCLNNTTHAQHSAPTVDYSVEVRLSGVQEGVRFEEEESGLVMESKVFPTDSGFVFKAEDEVPRTYQTMFKRALDSRHPNTECVLVVFDMGCLGVIKGCDVYLFRRI